MGGYAVIENRLMKAKKIEAVLSEHMKMDISGLTILDIGAGVGEIASYFATRNNVFTVDVENQLSEKAESAGIKFVKVTNEKLPFEDESFDIIISNHVIEHVENSSLHIKEMERCLKRGGIVYFSTPNRIFPKEPHTKTWLIHYLPNNMFFRCLRLIRNKKFKEPIYLLTYWQQKQLFTANGLKHKECTKDILNDPEKYFLDERVPFRVPGFLQALSKTNIFILFKQNEVSL